MFYALAITLSLAVMFLVMAITALLCVPAAKLLGKRTGSFSPGLAANILFAVRLLPLGLACLVTLGFALPAFVEFEPAATGEGISWRLVFLAIAGATVLLVLAFRATRILAATYRAQKQWIASSERLHVAGVDSPVHCVRGRSSLLAVTGIFRSRIFVAKEIVESLSAEELSAALAHELAHVASFDNLKQLLLRITRLPGWLSMLHTDDAAWTSASEVAADRTALSGGASALDLSSALVKVGRLSRPVTLSAADRGLASATAGMRNVAGSPGAASAGSIREQRAPGGLPAVRGVAQTCFTGRPDCGIGLHHLRACDAAGNSRCLGISGALKAAMIAPATRTR